MNRVQDQLSQFLCKHGNCARGTISKCSPVFAVALLIIAILCLAMVHSQAKEKCADELNFLANNNNNFYCENFYKYKKESIEFILNYNVNSIYKKISNISDYDRLTGVWELISLKKLLLTTKADLSKERIDQLFVAYDILNSQIEFEFQEKRIIYSTLKYYLFSNNIEFIKSNLLKINENSNKNHVILLSGAVNRVTEKLSCFAMLDLNGVAMEKIIASKIFSDCLIRLRGNI